MITNTLDANSNCSEGAPLQGRPREGRARTRRRSLDQHHHARHRRHRIDCRHHRRAASSMCERGRPPWASDSGCPRYDSRPMVCPLSLLVPLSGCIVIAPGFDAADNWPHPRATHSAAPAFAAKCRRPTSTRAGGRKAAARAPATASTARTSSGRRSPRSTSAPEATRRAAGTSSESAYGSAAKERSTAASRTTVATPA